MAPPVTGFDVSDTRDLFALAAFLVTGILTSYLSGRARREARNANQRRAEAVAAQERFRDLVNSVVGIVWEADAETFVFTFVSEQAQRVLGYPTESWLKEPAFWKDHLHPEDRNWAVQFFREAVVQKPNHDIEYRMIAADGRTVWMRDLITVVVESGRATRLRGVMVDITRRKRDEEALREQADLLNLTHDAIFVRDMQGTVKYWNHGAEEAYGWPPEQATGKIAHKLLKTIFPVPIQQIEEELMHAGRWEGEVVHTTRFGTPMIVASRWSPLHDNGGTPIAILETNNDITEQKRAEEALQRSEAYLAEAQRLSHTGSWAFSATSDMAAYWSEENFLIWGFDPEQGPPDLETVLQRVHPEDRGKLIGHAHERTDSNLEFRIVLSDATVKHIEAIGHPVLDAAGNLVEYLGTAVDVTERKRAEEERERLRQLEEDLAHINRVSMMGELAASLGHEVKQPIAAAITNANTCLRWLNRDRPDLEEAREAALRVVEDAMRSVEIINRTSSLFKKGASQRELVNINEVIDDIIALLRNEAVRAGVSMPRDLAADLPKVMGDRVQLQQVLMNLIINSIDAMKGIEGTREITLTSQCDGRDRLLVAVSDTGVGLPKEMGQIFEAFFTTKPHGTGMGLAISRTIIESHGGRLWAVPNSGRGAIFYFTLPTMVEVSA